MSLNSIQYVNLIFDFLNKINARYFTAIDKINSFYIYSSWQRACVFPSLTVYTAILPPSLKGVYDRLPVFFLLIHWFPFKVRPWCFTHDKMLVDLKIQSTISPSPHVCLWLIIEHSATTNTA